MFACGSGCLKWSKIQDPLKMSKVPIKESVRGPDLQWALDAWGEVGLFKLEGEYLGGGFVKGLKVKWGAKRMLLMP